MSWPGESDFEVISVERAGQALRGEVTRLIVLANADRRGLFPGDRLRSDTLETQYGDHDLLLLRSSLAVAGVLTMKGREEGLGIYLLAVRPELRGQGIGATMLDQAGRIGCERGYSALVLEAVDAGNLIAYYLGRGFLEVCRIRCEVGHWGATAPFELVTLMKPLTDSSRAVLR